MTRKGILATNFKSVTSSIGNLFLTSCLISTTKAVVEASGGKVVIGYDELSSPYNNDFYNHQEDTYNKQAFLREQVIKSLKSYTKHTSIDIDQLASEIIEAANEKLEGYGQQFNEDVDKTDFLADFILLQMHNKDNLEYESYKQFRENVKDTLAKIGTEYTTLNSQPLDPANTNNLTPQMLKQVAHRFEKSGQGEYGQDLLVAAALNNTHSSYFHTKTTTVKNAVKETFFKGLKEAFITTLEVSTEGILALLTGYTVDIQRGEDDDFVPSMSQYLETSSKADADALTREAGRLVENVEPNLPGQPMDAWMEEATPSLTSIDFASILVGSKLEVEGGINVTVNSNSINLSGLDSGHAVEAEV